MHKKANSFNAFSTVINEFKSLRLQIPHFYEINQREAQLNVQPLEWIRWNLNPIK